MSYRPFQQADTDAFARVISACFGSPVDAIPNWWDTLDRKNLRVVEDGGVIVGGLGDIPMGWFQGGRRLAMHGACGVAVAPEARGRGVAKAMMEAYVRELFDRDVPLASLYGSTRGLYRSVGYGIGGRCFTTEVDNAQFRAVGIRGDGWRRATAADQQAIQRVHRRLVEQGNGVERGPYLWARVWAYRGSPNDVLVCERGGEVVAWVALRQESRPDDWMAVNLLDHGAIDADAVRRVAGLLSTYAAMSHTTELKSGPEAPLLDILEENRVKQRLFEPWLMRVVRVRAALEQRGWGSVRGTVTFAVKDPVIAQNRGPWKLAVGDEVRCEPVQDASIRVHVRGLAGLFTGGASVQGLLARGLIEGPADEVARLGQLFATPAPSIRDYF